ncbi:MAG: transcriptional repressor [Muribaculaceae bacterium]|nr:transcriptional repressor [Muribaculaceae bacterium]MCM1399593.1 transcriptional repressor [Clostridium sp.]MCM1460147.1 transcriptional repressor [Bacteroides sp.]
MSAPIKYSHQREAILNNLKSRYDHPTAEMVFQDIRMDIPNISLATVYRNLNQLADAGIINRLCCNGKTDHFDATTKPHYHFLCTSCGAVKDIDMQPLESLITEASKHSPHTITEASVLFSGKCEACQA